jgi:hypothetical protein
MQIYAENGRQQMARISALVDTAKKEVEGETKR